MKIKELKVFAPSLAVVSSLIIGGMAFQVVSANTKNDKINRIKNNISTANFIDEEYGSINGEIDWSVAKDEVDYAIIRLCDCCSLQANGELIVDSQFYRNVEECKKHNIPFGVYYFSRAINKEQANAIYY